jgi:lysophospholipase L1-like esterase
MTLHFEDFESLRRYTTVDGDHLDAAGAREFSRRFAAIIRNLDM